MANNRTTIQRFQQYLDQQQLLRHGQSTLLAISGGVDSMVMAALFREAGLAFGMAHCHFGLRDEADADEQFAKITAEQWGVPFFSTRFDTTAYANEQGISTQMAARELRYQWLETIRKQEGYHRIATAHHKNDNVETVLLNLTKGTGMAGLHGILPLKDKLIRPLLCFSREEIEAYAAANNVPFRTDASNKSNAYERNRIRNEVLPQLLKLNPALVDTFDANIQRFKEIEAVYRQGLAYYKKKLPEQRGHHIFIPIRKLMQYAGYKTILYELLKDYGFGDKQLDDILQLLEGPSGKYLLTNTHRLLKDRRFLIVSPLDTETTDHIPINESDSNIKLPGGTLHLHIKAKSRIKGYKEDPKVAYLAYDELEYPLLLRRWKKGDYFYPFGMGRKKKKVSDFFSDQKLSIPEKEDAWLLFSGEKLACVVGHRSDERFKVKPGTRKVVVVELKLR